MLPFSVVIQILLDNNYILQTHRKFFKFVTFNKLAIVCLNKSSDDLTKQHTHTHISNIRTITNKEKNF